jgi:DNA polymerase-3 subunit delta'
MSIIFAEMQFKEVIGQKEVKTHLLDMVRHNRLSHALLFLGKEGSGALATALAFAQYVVCEKVNGKHTALSGGSLFGAESEISSQKAERHADSCGECAACIKASGYIHPDIHFSYPVVPRKAGDKPLSTDYVNEWREFITLYPYGNSYDWLQFIGAENKQGNITAYECNDILRKLSLKSFESEFKILIMWMPEYLGNEGNKLLKLIEEPPANTVFILAGENESMILPTILSRCLLVKIPALSTADIESALVNRCKLSEDQARQVASISDGNYREALQFIQHAEADWQDILREWLNAVLKTGPVAQVKWIEDISKMGRENQKQFLRYFNHLLQQSIRLRVIGNASLAHIGEKELDFISRINKIADISQQQTLVEELDKAMYYIERNANPKMLFHALTIKFYHIIKDKSLVTAW